MGQYDSLCIWLVIVHGEIGNILFVMDLRKKCLSYKMTCPAEYKWQNDNDTTDMGQRFQFTTTLTSPDIASIASHRIAILHQDYCKYLYKCSSEPNDKHVRNIMVNFNRQSLHKISS
jgi:hypothetical protein